MAMKTTLLRCAALIGLTAGIWPAAQAVPTSQAGTVEAVTVYGNLPGTYVFRMSFTPSTGCANNGWFQISPTTVQDAESRRSIVAALLSGKASGLQVVVAYDTAQFCDSLGFPAVYSVGVQ